MRPLIRQFIDKLWIHHAKNYKPKFQVGDIIINRYLEKATISKVVNVQLFDNRLTDVYAAQAIGQYRLLNLYSEHSMNSGKPRYTRNMYIQKIDPFYDKINPQTAQILYGISFEGDKK